MVSFARTSCPVGWSRYAGVDDHMLHASATPGGTGGSLTHTHGDDFAVSSAGAHTHDVSGTTDGNGGQYHQVFHTSSGGRLLSYNTAGSDVDVLTYPYNGYATGGTRAAAGEVQPSLTLYSKAVADHTHTFSATSASAGGHTHPLTGGVSASVALPPYVDVLVCCAD